MSGRVMGQDDVLVVLGAGRIGVAIAREVGAGRVVLIGDRDPQILATAAAELFACGLDVVARQVDVTSWQSVSAFAEQASRLGPVRQIVHAAGVSPGASSVEQVLEVDLIGTARVLEAFGSVVAPGGAGVVITSMAGHLGRQQTTPDQEVALALIPAGELGDMCFLQSDRFHGVQAAYGFAKHANRLRVKAVALSWAERGARLNSISPGVARAAGSEWRPDVAGAAAFLLGRGAADVTGTDLLVDGGALATVTAGVAHAQ